MARPHLREALRNPFPTSAGINDPTLTNERNKTRHASGALLASRPLAIRHAALRTSGTSTLVPLWNEHRHSAGRQSHRSSSEGVTFTFNAPIQ
jgi:hypothetical protein